jgi:antitoxin Phd
VPWSKPPISPACARRECRRNKPAGRACGGRAEKLCDYCSHKGASPVRTPQLRDAKASLSAVVQAAERGEATMITRRGRPAAVVVPVEDARRLYPPDRPSFVELPRAIPEAIEFERDSTPLREADL